MTQELVLVGLVKEEVFYGGQMYLGEAYIQQ